MTAYANASIAVESQGALSLALAASISVQRVNAMSDENGQDNRREFFWFSLALLIVLIGCAAQI